MCGGSTATGHAPRENHRMQVRLSIRVKGGRGMPARYTRWPTAVGKGNLEGRHGSQCLRHQPLRPQPAPHHCCQAVLRSGHRGPAPTHTPVIHPEFGRTPFPKFRILAQKLVKKWLAKIGQKIAKNVSQSKVAKNDQRKIKSEHKFDKITFVESNVCLNLVIHSGKCKCISCTVPPPQTLLVPTFEVIQAQITPRGVGNGAVVPVCSLSHKKNAEMTATKCASAKK